MKRHPWQTLAIRTQNLARRTRGRSRSESYMWKYWNILSFEISFLVTLDIGRICPSPDYVPLQALDLQQRPRSLAPWEWHNFRKLFLNSLSPSNARLSRAPKIAHLSRPWSIGWVALSFLFVCSFVRPSRYGNIPTSTCHRPPNPYIFWKLMIIAIQKWLKNTNTKTPTNTKTMTKIKTPRE